MVSDQITIEPDTFLENLASVTFEGKPIDPVAVLGSLDEWTDQAQLDFAVLRQSLNAFQRSDVEMVAYVHHNGIDQTVGFGRCIAELRDRFSKLSGLLEAAAIRVAAALARIPGHGAEALEIALATGRDMGGAASDAPLILACEKLHQIGQEWDDSDRLAEEAADGTAKDQHAAAAGAAEDRWQAQLEVVCAMPAQTSFGEAAKAAMIAEMVDIGADGKLDPPADPIEQISFSLARDVIRRTHGRAE